jgi:hypothetical protein
MADTGSYLYLAARNLTDSDLAGVTGLDGAQVRIVASGDLVAVVGTVDLAEFGEDALKRNLEDLAWLEKVARTHDDVIHRIADRATVAPLRLATILYDDQRVAELLDQRAADLTAVLDRVQDRAEWSVKLYGDVDSPQDEAHRDQPESGSAYLHRRKAEGLRRTESKDVATALAEQVHHRLTTAAAASRRLPPQDPRLTGHRGDMTLNGAYLVDKGNGQEFENLARTLSERHPQTRMEINGPWPPYSFATLEPQEQA